MFDTGSGGLAAVSLGIPETLLCLLVLIGVLIGLWKLGKVLWTIAH
jgi:hypothetical protein